ncbi:rare lipoprotein A [Nitrosomonas nitrosa]|uniref:Endolytic peptidoglycan transglycosylase RlpA n=1 Tax=Nitrosomonas nitrosa TaxID=52442 RepID=A0A1I4MU51_9PROT|nr:septal ring lytic transglycosylase RlpA family protein [Nitrosomonas nitrosa]MCO6435015.1 septal ring lytic transglycosylase RlpA family protein [Nitrosomonas nitrosa]PTR02145.1 rare lipoprotein A [Nitrosomonas nitrosa]CAE6505522.1 Endolytic peptidoglycan transglycosylase RlpA [Nitrosomonas nitrosa]SFM06824.1 rare lipoprotein A [Nitrosomonas nitrosa]
MKKDLISMSLIAAISFMVLGSSSVSAETGYAVHYSNLFQGKKTASKEIFDQRKLTAAHKKHPFGTRVKVTNLDNDQSVVVKINDRMPTRNSNIIDVSKRAAEELGFVKQGRAHVRLEVVD